MENRHVLSLIVENRPGVFSRIAGLLTRRGYNMDSISAAETDDPKVSLIVIVFRSDYAAAEQIKKQLHKQADVYEIKELLAPDAVTREHVMIKVKATPEERISIISVAGIFRANIIDVSPESLIIELTGESTKTQAFIETIKSFGVIQVARSGAIGMERMGAPVLNKRYEDF